MRLQDLSIAYDFPKRILNKIGMSGLRAYVSGKNLFTVTDWVGYDPKPDSPYSTERPPCAATSSASTSLLTTTDQSKPIP